MLGDYRIEGIVGVGRMGVVYLAIDRITGRAVALKVLREDVGIDPVYRERFRREGELLAALEHPHVLPIYGMGEIDGDLYIATRLVSSTLRDSILAGPIDVDDAMTVLACVASALDAAHANGVVHRDVKPANVLIDPGPRPGLPGRLRPRARPRGRGADRSRAGPRHDRLHGPGAARRRARRGRRPTSTGSRASPSRR